MGFRVAPRLLLPLALCLEAGKNVTAYQKIGNLESPKSQPVIVFSAPDLDPPTVQQPLVECQREVVVKDVVPGAYVTVYLDGIPFASAFASSSTVHVSTFPLPDGLQVQAKQQLNYCQESALSTPVTIDPFDREKLELKPSIVTPIFACQSTFSVKNLSPGTELDIYLDSSFKKRVSVNNSSIQVGVQPPLAKDQKIQVIVVACGIQGASSDTVVVQTPKDLKEPKLLGPIYHGDPFVIVEEAPSSSLVLIYADGNQIGAGMGGLPSAKILLWNAAKAGQKVEATLSLCNIESDPSNAVIVEGNRPPLPHDVMLKYYWLDAQGYAQSILFISGRNIYQGSKIRIDNVEYPTFPWAQLTPDFGFDKNELGTPIDTIGGVVMLLYQDANSNRFFGTQIIDLAIENPDGSTGDLRHYRNYNGGGFVNNYRLRREYEFPLIVMATAEATLKRNPAPLLISRA